ncbi:MAG: hypothetical protein ACKO3P_13635 [Planctomycetaceae bacterium]
MAVVKFCADESVMRGEAAPGGELALRQVTAGQAAQLVRLRSLTVIAQS